MFVYSRETETTKVLVVTNMRDQVESISLPIEVKTTLLSNYNREYNDGNINLMPYETLVLEIR